MRSSKLIRVLATSATLFAAAATLLALTPTVTSARRLGHRRSRESGGCRVNIQVPQTPLTVGEPVTLFGHLRCGVAANAAAQTVTVYQHTAGTRGFLTAGTAVTETSGAYQLTVPAPGANSTFYATYARAQSAHRTVRVAPQVTLTSPTEGTQLIAAPRDYTSNMRYNAVRDRVVFTGTVSPADVGAIVTLQRESATADEEWRRIGGGRVGPGGTYSIAHNFRVPGDANIRVVVHPQRHEAASFAAGASTPVSYEISEAQNPGLTLYPSADPTVYGQSIMITGTLAAGAYKPVALFAHLRGGRFRQVGSATTGASGSYSFTESPAEDTYYYVAGGGKISAVLFEAVKYALTVVRSASTVPTGQPLTISGTIAPDRAGHAVYLEREDASGIGFHAVDVGLVSAGGSFTITHAFYGMGSGRLRIKVPGDGLNAGADSPPFEIDVTPAPAATIIPEAPTNTTLPKEGQL